MSKSRRRRSQERSLGVSLLLILALFAYREFVRPRVTDVGSDSKPKAELYAEITSDLTLGEAALEEAAAAQESGVLVSGKGTVTKLLPDDREGSRHQRFILLLRSGRTVLVAHNIDIAPRLPVAKGDHVEFQGQYEWNERGGVIHWTHHDPGGRHKGGWLRLAGRTYE